MWRKVFVGLFQQKATFRKQIRMDKTMKRECLHGREEEIRHKYAENVIKRKKTVLYPKWKNTVFMYLCFSDDIKGCPSNRQVQKWNC